MKKGILKQLPSFCITTQIDTNKNNIHEDFTTISHINRNASTSESLYYKLISR
jgi:hypothetical protein